MYKLKVPDEVAELIRRLHPHLKRKIKASLRMILTEPSSGKELRDELAGLRSYRVSRFRIVYRVVHRRHIEVVAIGPRERIYEVTYRVVRGEEKKEIHGGER